MHDDQVRARRDRVLCEILLLARARVAVLLPAVIGADHRADALLALQPGDLRPRPRAFLAGQRRVAAAYERQIHAVLLEEAHLTPAKVRDALAIERRLRVRIAPRAVVHRVVVRQTDHLHAPGGQYARKRRRPAEAVGLVPVFALATVREHALQIDHRHVVLRKQREHALEEVRVALPRLTAHQRAFLRPEPLFAAERHVARKRERHPLFRQRARGHARHHEQKRRQSLHPSYPPLRFITDIERGGAFS